MNRLVVLIAATAALSLAMAGTASAVVITPDDGDFGSVTVGETSAPRTYTIALFAFDMSYGPDPEVVDLNGLGEFSLASNGCTFPLSVSGTQSCTLSVVYSPKRAGPAVGTLSSGPAMGGDTLGLTGNGVEPPAKTKKKKCKKGKRNGKATSAAAKKKRKCKKKGKKR